MKTSASRRIPLTTPFSPSSPLARCTWCRPMRESPCSRIVCTCFMYDPWTATSGAVSSVSGSPCFSPTPGMSCPCAARICVSSSERTKRLLSFALTTSRTSASVYMWEADVQTSASVYIWDPSFSALPTNARSLGPLICTSASESNTQPSASIATPSSTALCRSSLVSSLERSTSCAGGTTASPTPELSAPTVAMIGTFSAASFSATASFVAAFSIISLPGM
mmetsp:Transcript_6136/g.14340  ORF Transcript_6136/g.14340 Transcript_6136/m.14340 type:complete len:222 (+) Transcript_6136:794-1459(+)